MTEPLTASGLAVAAVPGQPATLPVTDVTGAASVRGWLAEHREPLRAELLRHGHLLIRGLEVRSPEEFATVRDVLIDRPAPHSREETTSRSAYGDGVFSATDLPPEQTIRLHHEDSYSVTFPGLLIFSCLVAAETGGATTIGDARSVRDLLPADLVAEFRSRGWLMVRNYTEHVGLSWQRTFDTDDPAMVERYCAPREIGWEWRPGGQLRTTALRAATIRHPRSGEEIWCNHVAVFNEWTHDADVREILVEAYGPDGLPHNTYYGDGGAIEPSVVAALNKAYDEATVPVRWQPGDLLLVDNVLCGHGREPYRGSREVLVAMGDPIDVRDCAPSGPIGPAPREES
ncbi:TauD/TfdA family dioxygenase [Actinophytocola sp.]|uniref:TauD/TfdA family dioxygenase n=1 Tax=Actinophytocola sp. TaxID=1872138 RepID=UPI00389A2D5C